MTGAGRPVQAETVYEILRRDYGYPGSYRGVVRHLRRRYGVPPVRALRRVETPPGVQAQHDWFEVRTRVAGESVRLPTLVGVLSHSRARFPRVSREASQLAWQAGHLALFGRYGGVPLWVRIDNLKTGVASGAGPTAVLNDTYRVFARECGFQVDPCRPSPIPAATVAPGNGIPVRRIHVFERFHHLTHGEPLLIACPTCGQGVQTPSPYRTHTGHDVRVDPDQPPDNAVIHAHY